MSLTYNEEAQADVFRMLFPLLIDDDVRLISIRSLQRNIPPSHSFKSWNRFVASGKTVEYEYEDGINIAVLVYTQRMQLSKQFTKLVDLGLFYQDASCSRHVYDISKMSYGKKILNLYMNQSEPLLTYHFEIAIRIPFRLVNSIYDQYIISKLCDTPVFDKEMIWLHDEITCYESGLNCEVHHKKDLRKDIRYTTITL
jgi:hypothetical protein